MTEQRTREEHVRWCKERALAIVETGDLEGAWASMVSDLSDHMQTVGHPVILLGTMLMLSGHLGSQKKMKKFIEDF